MKRMIKIGDIIVYKDSADFIGLVTEIHLDKWGLQRNVFIEWSTSPPLDYRADVGYHGSNIYNQRSLFDVIRNGVKIK